MKYVALVNNYQLGAKVKTTPVHKIISQERISSCCTRIVYDLDTDREREFVEKFLAHKLIKVENNG